MSDLLNQNNNSNASPAATSANGLFSGNKKYFWIVGVAFLVIILLFVFSGGEEETVKKVAETIEKKEVIEETKAKTIQLGPITDPAADCFERTSKTETSPLRCGPSVDISSFEASQTGNEVTIKLTLAEELPSSFTVNQANKLPEQEWQELIGTLTGPGEPGFYWLSFALDEDGMGINENIEIVATIFETGINTRKFNEDVAESNTANVKIDGKTITITDTLTFDLRGIEVELFLAVYGTELEGHDIARI